MADELFNCISPGGGLIPTGALIELYELPSRFVDALKEADKEVVSQEDDVD